MRGTQVVYFQSLNRHFNFLGVDRQLFFLFVGLTLPIAFSSHLKITMIITAVVTFIFLYAIGLLITRADNQALAIYKRHIHYQKYYAPHPGIHAKIKLVKPSVPYYQGKGGLL